MDGFLCPVGVNGDCVVAKPRLDGLEDEFCASAL